MIERFGVGLARSSYSQPFALRSENNAGSKGLGGGVVRLAGFGTEKLSCLMSKWETVKYNLSDSLVRTPYSVCSELVSGGTVLTGLLIDGPLDVDCSE